MGTGAREGPAGCLDYAAACGRSESAHWQQMQEVSEVSAETRHKGCWPRGTAQGGVRERGSLEAFLPVSASSSTVATVKGETFHV